MFNQLSNNKPSFNFEDFSHHFRNLSFSGTQYIKASRQESETRLNRSQSTKIKTVRTANTQTSKWEADVLDKLKLLIKQSGKPLDKIFKNFDTNQNGLISREEFVDALMSLSLSVSQSDIKKIMDRVDANRDGAISYSEFVAKLRDDPLFEERMKQRASNKLAKLKQMMTQHMQSVERAFGLVSCLIFYFIMF